MKKTIWVATIAILALFAVGFAASDEESNSDVTGTYQVTDEMGQTLILNLKEDKTATATIKEEGKTYYCTWRDFRNIDHGIEIYFSDEKPYLVYDNGSSNNSYVALDKGWLYEDETKLQAQNPGWRLKATKIK